MALTAAQTYAESTEIAIKHFTTPSDISSFPADSQALITKGRKALDAKVQDGVDSKEALKQAVEAYGQHLKQATKQGGTIKTFEQFAGETLSPEQIGYVNENVLKSIPKFETSKTNAFGDKTEAEVAAITPESRQPEKEGWGSWAKKNGGAIAVGIIALFATLQSGAGFLMSLALTALAVFVATKVPAVQNMFEKGLDAVGLGKTQEKEKTPPAKDLKKETDGPAPKEGEPVKEGEKEAAKAPKDLDQEALNAVRQQLIKQGLQVDELPKTIIKEIDATPNVDGAVSGRKESDGVLDKAEIALLAQQFKADGNNVSTDIATAAADAVIKANNNGGLPLKAAESPAR